MREHILGTRRNVIVLSLSRRGFEKPLYIAGRYAAIKQDEVVSHRCFWRGADILETDGNFLSRSGLESSDIETHFVVSLDFDGLGQSFGALEQPPTEESRALHPKTKIGR